MKPGVKDDGEERVSGSKERRRAIFEPPSVAVAVGQVLEPFQHKSDISRVLYKYLMVSASLVFARLLLALGDTTLDPRSKAAHIIAMPFRYYSAMSCVPLDGETGWITATNVRPEPEG